MLAKTIRYPNVNDLTSGLTYRYDQGRVSRNAILRRKRKNRRAIGFQLFNCQNHHLFVVNVRSGEIRKAVHFGDR